MSGSGATSIKRFCMQNQLIWAVTRIVPIVKGKDSGSATGFFFRRDDGVHLVTNRHVIIDEEKGFFPEALKIRIHIEKEDLTLNKEISMSLYREKERLWREHSLKEIDVVALKVNFGEMGDLYYKAFTRRNFVPKDVEIGFGHDVLVVGYPYGYHDYTHNLPVARNAMVASFHPVPFEGSPFFLIDGNLHRGMSGSPVFSKPPPYERTKTSAVRTAGQASFFLGIHSASVSIIKEKIESMLREQSGNEKGVGELEPLGLNVVWFPQLIEELA